MSDEALGRCVGPRFDRGDDSGVEPALGGRLVLGEPVCHVPFFTGSKPVSDPDSDQDLAPALLRRLWIYLFSSTFKYASAVDLTYSLRKIYAGVPRFTFRFAPGCLPTAYLIL